MKTIITILIAFFSININAQTTYKLDQLVGTKWQLVGYTSQAKDYPPGKYRVCEFTKDSIIITSNYFTEEKPDETQADFQEIASKTIIISKKYYLSDAVPKSFDHTKVGKVKKGSFLIIYNDKVNCREYYYISEMTNEKLSLFHKADLEVNEYVNYTTIFKRVE